MPLTTNRDLDHYIDRELRTVAVAAAKHIYKGAFVGLNSSGYGQPLVAGDPFFGIAYEEKDNTSGANGAMAVRVYTVGDFAHSLTGATAASVGRPVFASADNTLTFDGAGASFVGHVLDVPAANQILLRIDTGGGRIKTVTHLIEDAAAGVDISTRAVHTFDAAGWITAARVVNQSTAAAGINDSNTCVVDLTIAAASIASKTFNTGNPFPNANTSIGMGTISNARVAQGSVLNVAVTNGTTANPGTFLVEVDYV